MCARGTSRHREVLSFPGGVPAPPDQASQTKEHHEPRGQQAMTEATEQRIREQAADLERRWSTDPRWKGVERTYTAEDVIRLQGSFHVEHSIARAGAERLWDLVHDTEYVNALGALTGGQAVEMVQGRIAGDLPVRLAGGGRRQRRGPDLPRPVPLPRQLRAAGRAPHQQRVAAGRPDRLGLRRRDEHPSGWRRSSPTPRPASAVRSTPSS